LLTLNREDALAAVIGGKAQLGVAPLDDVPAQLQSTVLTTVGQVLAVPECHRLARRARLKLTDLAGERLVVPPRGRPHREMLAALLRSAEVPWEASVEANGWELMLSFVAMGAGVAVVNACCRMPAGVVRIALPELPVLRYHCFHLRGLPKATPAGQLRVALQEHGSAWRSPP
jgi:DNA-binding transcriptional LysR family regulator